MMKNWAVQKAWYNVYVEKFEYRVANEMVLPLPALIEWRVRL